MMPEERIAQAIAEWGRCSKLMPPELKHAIADSIRAAVTKAVAEEREACARQLDKAAAQYHEIGKITIVKALEHEAASIYARNPRKEEIVDE